MEDGSATYQLSFVICLIILGDLGDDDILAVANDGCDWLEEDEWVRRRRSVGLLNCRTKAHVVRIID